MNSDHSLLGYDVRYVAFLDILGFSNIVAASACSVHEADRLISVLRRISSFQEDFSDAEYEPVDFQVQSFSDCIVMSEAGTPDGLVHLINCVVSAILDLLTFGFFVRGAVAKGPLHHVGSVILGPALIKAYKMEASVARYPRVLVDEETYADFRSPKIKDARKRKFEHVVRSDDDGPPILDYLHPIRFIEAQYPEQAPDAECMRTEIERALHRSIYDPSHYEKMRWLSVQWNNVALHRSAKLIRFPNQELQSEADKT